MGLKMRPKEQIVSNRCNYRINNDDLLTDFAAETQCVSELSPTGQRLRINTPTMKSCKHVNDLGTTFKNSVGDSPNKQLLANG
jgi:hypothetical protein